MRMTDSRNVTISLEGFNELDGESTVATHRAIHHYKNGIHYVRYEEKQDDKIVRNMIKINETRIEVMKKGYINSKMVFEEGKKHTNDYHTPYGLMKMTVHTKKMNIDESDMAIVAELDYNLAVDEQHISKCSIKINIKNEMSD